MMKGLVMDENMSNLTSASSEISASSGARNENCSLYAQHSAASTNLESQPKRKRSLPGQPDPEAEVIALSPQTLLATNRFICEICNKGFQRDQNLQLHRRGHNLPWKLKKKNSKEIIRKKVYVCPEPTCVHHDPSRALGDLTGIKKHFFRKHGEKKWKCEKCSKRYAVQSDWKAHSKICGTREYKCDCGTIFSRRDSFITHRAFCDVLAQESFRAMTPMNPLLQFHNHSHGLQPPSLKKEQEHFNFRQQIPPWLTCSSSSLLSTHLNHSLSHHHENPNPTTLLFNSSTTTTASPHMSATALLHKASQIGVTTTVNKTEPSLISTTSSRPHYLMQTHVPAELYGNSHSFMGSSSSDVSRMVMPSREEIGTNFSNCLASYGNKAAIHSDNCFEESADQASCILHDVMGGFESSSFEGVNAMTMRGMFDTQGDEKGGGVNTANDEMTKDFLSLGGFSQRDLFNISGIGTLDSLSFGKQNQSQEPWRG